MMAQLLGTHIDQVSRYTREGMPTLTESRGGKLMAYDAVKALAWWRQKKQGSPEFERARKDRTQADLNELRLAIQRGDYLKREVFILASRNVVEVLKAKFLALGHRLVQKNLIPIKAEEQVNAEVREALAELVRLDKLTETKTA